MSQLINVASIWVLPHFHSHYIMQDYINVCHRLDKCTRILHSLLSLHKGVTTKGFKCWAEPQKTTTDNGIRLHEMHSQRRWHSFNVTCARTQKSHSEKSWRIRFSFKVTKVPAVSLAFLWHFAIYTFFVRLHMIYVLWDSVSFLHAGMDPKLTCSPPQVYCSMPSTLFCREWPARMSMRELSSCLHDASGSCCECFSWDVDEVRYPDTATLWETLSFLNYKLLQRVLLAENHSVDVWT